MHDVEEQSIDSVFCFKELCKKAVNREMVLYLTRIDLHKANGIVTLSKLWIIMRQAGVSTAYIT